MPSAEARRDPQQALGAPGGCQLQRWMSLRWFACCRSPQTPKHRKHRSPGPPVSSSPASLPTRSEEHRKLRGKAKGDHCSLKSDPRDQAGRADGPKVEGDSSSVL